MVESNGMIAVVVAQMQNRIEELERQNAQLLSENMEMSWLIKEIMPDIGKRHTYPEERHLGGRDKED